MPHIRKKGYRQGTHHPTYGYSTYDWHYDTPFEEIQEVLCDFVESLILDTNKKINYASLEGEFILKTIKKKYNLTRPNVEEAERQIQIFNKKDMQLKLEIAEHNQKLQSEIDEHNKQLGLKCFLIGLFIVTIPFCIGYYETNKRDKDKENFRHYPQESTVLRDKIIDDELQKRVQNYKSELIKYAAEVNEYKIKSHNAYMSPNLDENNIWYKKAVASYKNKDFKNFCFQVIKSIKKNNGDSIYLLAKLFEKGEFFEQNLNKTIHLLLYSSYLGSEKASKKLSKILIDRNIDVEFGYKFLEKKVNRYEDSK